jgi:hypothetical protein
LLIAAVLLLTLAVTFGAGLGLWHLRAAEGGVTHPPASVGIIHGLIGAGGLAVLLMALRSSAHGVEAGAGSFGLIAAAFFAAALMTGLAILARRRKNPVVTMAIHSGLAIVAYVMLMAWNSLS